MRTSLALIAVGIVFAAQCVPAGATPVPALRGVVERGYARLDKDASKLAVFMGQPIVPSGTAQVKAVAALERMHADLSQFETQIAGAAGSSPAGIYELQAIVQLGTALTTFQSALTATTSAQAISLSESMQAQLAIAKASLNQGAQLLGCPTTC